MFQFQRFLTTITVLHEQYSICPGHCKHQPVCWYGRPGHRLYSAVLSSDRQRPALGCCVRGHDEIYTLCNPNSATPLSKMPTNGAHFPVPALQPSIASRSDKLKFYGSFCNHSLSTPVRPSLLSIQITTFLAMSHFHNYTSYQFITGFWTTHAAATTATLPHNGLLLYVIWIILTFYNYS
jgi:hypothetical protein